MKTKLKNFVMALFLTVSVTGCVKTITASGTQRPNPPAKFNKIAGANLKVEVVGKRQLLLEVDDSITVKITNMGYPIKIEEWYEKEIDNLIISYQDWIPGTTEPNPAAWQTIRPIIFQPASRYPLDLAPNNAIFIRAGLPFLEGLKISKDKERRFFVKISLNLKSVNATSEIYGLSILSAI